MTDQVWRMLFREAIKRSGEDEAVLYIQVTRGVATSRSTSIRVVHQPY